MGGDADCHIIASAGDELLDSLSPLHWVFIR